MSTTIQTTDHDKSATTAAARLGDLSHVEEYLAQERTAAALQMLAHTAKSVGAAQVHVEFIEGAHWSLMDPDGDEIHEYPSHVEDALYEAAGCLDDRHPSLLRGRARLDQDGDPVWRVCKHTGQIDWVEFDIDETLELRGRPRPQSSPPAKDINAWIAARVRQTFTLTRSTTNLTDEAQAEANRAELYAMALAIDLDTATAYTNLNEVDDYGGETTAVHAGQERVYSSSKHGSVWQDYATEVPHTFPLVNEREHEIDLARLRREAHAEFGPGQPLQTD